MKRLLLAWHVLRGHTVAYRLTIRDGGLDLRGHPKAYLDQVVIVGAPIGVQLGSLTWEESP